MATYPGSDRVIRMNTTTQIVDETPAVETNEPTGAALPGCFDRDLAYEEWLADVERQREADALAEAEWAEMMVRAMEGR